ncbi:hypothetical protein ACKUB1_13705 [Methanospirillum stamsii]|uniref:Uncharacterized protein n=1 Tax=Methanospirillum stamsii TaxID=1277351 RepID=A0A2V2NEN0_9EURY|nr:hypothetical protein [Methanospirillum stamsii]PWR74837.1 hypothetical protein DLD82_08035 [Methanospirillum stamsii]
MSLRKFKNPKTNSVREEGDLFEFIKELGFEYGSVLRIGGQITGQVLMESGQLSEDLIHKYQSLFDGDITYYLEKRRLSSKAADIVVSYSHHLEEVHSEQDLMNELMSVYDSLDEIKRKITRAQFEAESWRYKIIVQKPSGDDEQEDSE